MSQSMAVKKLGPSALLLHGPRQEAPKNPFHNGLDKPCYGAKLGADFSKAGSFRTFKGLPLQRPSAGLRSKPQVLKQVLAGPDPFIALKKKAWEETPNLSPAPNFSGNKDPARGKWSVGL